MNNNQDKTFLNNQTICTGLSGNEIYCLNLYGYQPGNLLIGNSVFALGLIGGMTSSIRTTVGGEIKQLTKMIAEGRRLSLGRFEEELNKSDGVGATGLSSQIIFHAGNVEFLSIGSTVHRQDNNSNQVFTTASDGQELFCQLDMGYAPIKFVFGNVAYSIGFMKSFFGGLKQITKGEVKQYSDIFDTTRRLALTRMMDEAKSLQANSVIGIKTTILPLGPQGIQEMVMVGTASYNQQLESLSEQYETVLTSNLNAEEMWNLAQIGYAPVGLLLSTSVYSLGLIGSIKASLKNLIKGEISDLTDMIYGARQKAIEKLQNQANDLDANLVVGIKTYIYDLGSGLIEFLAIGTAVKKVETLKTNSNQLPVQAVIKEKTTFINSYDALYDYNLQNQNPKV